MKLTSIIFISFFCLQGALAQTLDETFEGTQDLTDQERAEAESFTHQGIQQERYAQGCGEGGKAYEGCGEESLVAGQAFSGSGGQAVEEILPKLYAVMGTLAAASSGGIGKIKMKAGTDENGEKQTEEKSDLCIYIPTVGEIIASTTQAIYEKKLTDQTQVGATNTQRESILRVARIHKQRAKTATMQATTYASTAACYVAYMSTGAALGEPSLWIKLGAASAMSAIFIKKVNNHRDYQKILEEVANRLPHEGECNPITETQCFCSEPTSQAAHPSEYQKYCLPEELAKSGAEATTCAVIDENNQVQVDTLCDCKKTNTCANTTLVQNALKFGLGQGFVKTSAQGIDLLNSGTFNQASFDSFNSNAQALAQKGLSKTPQSLRIPNSSTKNPTLSQKIQKETGLSPTLANHFANQDSSVGSNSKLAKAIAPPQSAISESSAIKILGDDAFKLSYQNAKKSRPKTSSQANSKENPFDKFFNKNKKKKGRDAIKVLEFAQKAQQEAEITKEKSRPIFEIISSRYKKTPNYVESVKTDQGL